MNDVCVIGLGYIGLPTAAVLAQAGKQVLGVDLNSAAVEAINSGTVHIVEPGLEDAVKETVAAGRLRAAAVPEESSAFILAVPTPVTPNRSVDLSYVFEATKDITPYLQAGNLVILESTSPPGATRKIAALVAELRPDLVDDEGASLVHFAHAPERVLPGNTMKEIIDNDRVLGGLSPEAAHKTEELYRSFVQGEILLTDATTAELVKLSENSFRDVNIAFANELSLIADELDINVWEVIRLANRHPRVNIMQPGPGVGGHCIAVDPWFIVDAAPTTARLIRTAREVNDSKPAAVIASVEQAIECMSSEPSIAVLGLAFKKNIDDLRESPSLEIAVELAKRFPEATFHIREPFLPELPAVLRAFSNVQYAPTTSGAILESGIVLVLVDHDDFVAVDLNELTDKTVIDTRGIWDELRIKKTEEVTP